MKMLYSVKEEKRCMFMQTFLGKEVGGRCYVICR